MKRGTDRKSGFTLIELVVVLAILGILVTLLIPAVQKVRAGAARSECQNHLKQIALALHSYHEAHGRFPHGLMFEGICNPLDHGENFGPNWAVLILPYVEQEELFAPIATSINAYMSNGSSTWRNVRSKTIPIYLCPSDAIAAQTPFKLAGTDWARGNFAANAGPAAWCTNNPCLPGQPLNTSGINRLANPQVSREVPRPGPGYPAALSELISSPVIGLNFGRRLSKIRDGTSVTVALDEIRIGSTSNDIRGTWALGLVGASLHAGAARDDNRFPNWNESEGDDIHGCTNDPLRGMGCQDTCLAGATVARSRHPGGANVGFCDGAVKFVTNDIGQIRWYLMHSAGDGIDFDPAY